MNSTEAREYVRIATTETKGRTKTACDLLISESIKLEKIEQIVKRVESLHPEIAIGDREGIRLIREVLNE